MIERSILGMYCGSRMFWFDKQDTHAVFNDVRTEGHGLCDGRRLVISPDLIPSFRPLPFANSSFSVVVLNPPHLERVGQSVWMGKKYRQLNRENVALWLIRQFQGGFSYTTATRRSHIRMGQDTDPGWPDSGVYRCETCNWPAYREGRQNPLDCLYGGRTHEN